MLATLAVGAALIVTPLSDARAAGAVILRDQDCFVFDGNGQFALVDTCMFVVRGQGGVFTAVASVTPPDSGKTVHFDFASTGAHCGIPGTGESTKWQETVSPNGHATVTCIVRTTGSSS
jgi:hypothetical protein